MGKTARSWNGLPGSAAGAVRKVSPGTYFDYSIRAQRAAARAAMVTQPRLGAIAIEQRTRVISPLPRKGAAPPA